MKTNNKKIENIQLQVQDSNTLFNFLSIKTHFNQKQIKKLFLDKKIFINNILADNINHLLNLNDVVLIKLTNDSSKNNQSSSNIQDIKVLYEDDYLLVIDKPNNLLTHKTNFNEDNTLQDYLVKKYPALKDVERNGITHRLDKDTTGILVVAKNNDVFKMIQNAFETNNVIRKYQAIVLNQFKDNYYEIDTMIGYYRNNSLKMTTSNPKNPKRAITLLKVLEPISEKYSLVECELKTGRTHQIRVHMNFINHPILNDPLYGNKIDNDDFNQYLHCKYVKFSHPILFTNIEIVSELPTEFQQKMMELKNEK